jgi:hypothetical protein
MEIGESGQNTQDHGDNTGKGSYEIGKGKPPQTEASVATRFGTSTGNKPDQVKSAITRKIKKEGRERLREMLSMKYKFTDDSKVRLQLVNAFGRGVLRLTVWEIVQLQQFQKAILAGDSTAAAYISNQAFGLLKQTMEHSGPNGNPIETVATTKRVIIQNPHLNQGNNQ